MIKKELFNTGLLPFFSHERIFIVNYNDIHVYQSDLNLLKKIDEKWFIYFDVENIILASNINNEIFSFDIISDEIISKPKLFPKGSPINQNDYLVKDNKNKELGILNISSGEYKWKKQLYDYNLNRFKVFGDYIIGTKKNSNLLYCFNANDGNILWTFNLGELSFKPNGLNLGNTYLLGNCFVSSTEQNLWYAFNASNNKLHWTQQLPNKIISSKVYRENYYLIGIPNYAENAKQQILFCKMNLSEGVILHQIDLTGQFQELGLIPKDGIKFYDVFSSCVGESHFFFSNNNILYAISFEDFQIREVYRHKYPLGMADIYNKMLFINDDEHQLLVLTGEELQQDTIATKFS